MDKQADRRRGLGAAALTVVGLAIAVWLLRSISWKDISGALGRLAWSDVLVGFAMYLVFLAFKAARFGALLGLRGQSRRLLGLGVLVIGGIVTGVILGFAPFILYPNDQYPVSFMWTLGGGPIGFVAWLAMSFGRKASGK